MWKISINSFRSKSVTFTYLVDRVCLSQPTWFIFWIYHRESPHRYVPSFPWHLLWYLHYIVLIFIRESLTKLSKPETHSDLFIPFLLSCISDLLIFFLHQFWHLPVCRLSCIVLLHPDERSGREVTQPVIVEWLNHLKVKDIEVKIQIRKVKSRKKNKTPSKCH